MSPTIPACDGRWLTEGFTYRFRDPHRGEIVAFHARGQLGGSVVPDPEARDLNIGKRVIGVPGDSVVGRGGRVFVNGEKADDIRDGRLSPNPSRRGGVLRPRRQSQLLAGQPRLRACTSGRDLRSRGSHLLAARTDRGAWLRQGSRTTW